MAKHDIVEDTKWQTYMTAGASGALWQEDSGRNVPNDVHRCTKCGISVDLNKVDYKKRYQKLQAFKDADNCPVDCK